MNPTPRTLQRINYLRDPATLDDLLDAFQEMGMPMGSDRWAEYCITLMREHQAKTKALNEVMTHVEAAQEVRANAADAIWIKRRMALTDEFQRRSNTNMRLEERSAAE